MCRPTRAATLDVSGVSGAGGFQLAGSQTLGGYGIVNGPVTIASGATLAPVNAGGTLTFLNNLTLAGASNFNINGAANDQVTVGGSLTYGGALNVTFVTTPGAGRLHALQFHRGFGERHVQQHQSAAPPAGMQWATFGSSDFDYATGQVDLVTIPTLINSVWTATGGVGTVLWSDSNNWSAGVPHAQGDSATFGSGTTPTIDLAGGTETVSSLTFTNSSGVNYTIIDSTGTGSLALEGTGGSSPAGVTVVSGSHTIDARVAFLSNVAVSGSGTLALGSSSSITDNGNHYGLTLDGPGTLILGGADTYSGGTFVDAGTLEVTAAAALPAGASLTVGAGGTFLFDPTGSAATMEGRSAGVVAAVPEPGTLALLTGAGIVAGLATWRSKRGIGDLRK